MNIRFRVRGGLFFTHMKTKIYLVQMNARRIFDDYNLGEYLHECSQALAAFSSKEKAKEYIKKQEEATYKATFSIITLDLK